MKVKRPGTLETKSLVNRPASFCAANRFHAGRKKSREIGSA
jgi:hypothetical protein